MAHTKYTCVQDTEEQFQEKLIDSELENTEEWKGFKSIRLIVVATDGASTVNTQIVGFYNTKSTEKFVYFTGQQLSQFKNYHKVKCERSPNFSDVVFEAANSTPTELSFTKDTRKSVFIPSSKSIAARIILAFYNDFSDPSDRIMEIAGEADVQRVARVLTTYYLSCLKYITDFDSIKVSLMDPSFELLIDDMALLQSSSWKTYNQAKSVERDISPSLICFQAVYGAFCICRSVSSKKDFKQ